MLIKCACPLGTLAPECDNRVLGGVVSSDTFEHWEQIATEKQAKAEALRLEQERLKAERRERRDKDSKLKTELKRRGPRC